MKERLTRGSLDMETVKELVYGNTKPQKPFLDAWNLQDISEENQDALPRGIQPGVDYTTFGNLKKMDS